MIIPTLQQAKRRCGLWYYTSVNRTFTCIFSLGQTIIHLGRFQNYVEYTAFLHCLFQTVVVVVGTVVQVRQTTEEGC